MRIGRDHKACCWSRWSSLQPISKNACVSITARAQRSNSQDHVHIEASFWFVSSTVQITSSKNIDIYVYIYIYQNIYPLWSLILQTLIDTKYVFLCNQWKMCCVYSVPKPMKKYLIPRMISCHIEKCFFEKLRHKSVSTRWAGWKLWVSEYRKWARSLNSRSELIKAFLAALWPLNRFHGYKSCVASSY